MKKQTILDKFEAKWCKEGGIRFLEPFCHLDDVREVLDLQKKRAVRIVEKASKDLVEGKIIETEAFEIIQKMKKSIKEI